MVRAVVPFLQRQGLRAIEGEPDAVPLHRLTFQPSSVRPVIRRLLRGNTLYGIHCRSCHGTDLRGGERRRN